MATIGKVNVELDNDVYWLLGATRMMVCERYDCKNHKLNHAEIFGRADCALKAIFIDKNGQCGYYAPMEKRHEQT